MNTANLNFDDIEVEKSAFYKPKHSINIGKVDIKKNRYPTKFDTAKEFLNSLLDTKMMETITLNHYV